MRRRLVLRLGALAQRVARLDIAALGAAQIFAALGQPIGCLRQHAAAQQRRLVAGNSGPEFDIRFDLIEPSQKGAVAVDPVHEPGPMADQGLMRDLDRLAPRRGRVGHHQAIFLVGQPLRQVPSFPVKFAARQDAARVLLAFAKAHQARKQLSKRARHSSVQAAARHRRVNRLGSLRQRALDAANIVIALARNLTPALAPPHLAQRKLQQRQAARSIDDLVKQRFDQTGFEFDRFVLRRPNDRLFKFIAIHRPEIFDMALQRVGERAMQQRAAKEIGAHGYDETNVGRAARILQKSCKKHINETPPRRFVGDQRENFFELIGDQQNALALVAGAAVRENIAQTQFAAAQARRQHFGVAQTFSVGGTFDIERRRRAGESEKGIGVEFHADTEIADQPALAQQAWREASQGDGRFAAAGGADEGGETLPLNCFCKTPNGGVAAKK